MATAWCSITHDGFALTRSLDAPRNIVLALAVLASACASAAARSAAGSRHRTAPNHLGTEARLDAAARGSAADSRSERRRPLVLAPATADAARDRGARRRRRISFACF